MAWIPRLRLGFEGLRLKEIEAQAVGRAEVELGLGLGLSRGLGGKIYKIVYLEYNKKKDFTKKLVHYETATREGGSPSSGVEKDMNGGRWGFPSCWC